MSLPHDLGPSKLILIANLAFTTTCQFNPKVDIDRIDLKLSNGDKLAEEINGVLEKHDDNIKVIFTSLDQWQVFQKDTDTKHLETVEKMKEISVLNTATDPVVKNYNL